MIISRRSPCLAAATVGWLASVMADSGETIDDMAARFQKEQGLPGLVVASVAQTKTKGLQMWTGAYGKANIDGDQPMTTDTSLWLASLTKAVVGTTMAKAKEQGHLTYDTKASEILQNADSFVIGNPETMPWLDDITLEHLATHRSTIRDDYQHYMCGYYVGDPTPGDYTLLLNLFGLENACADNSPVALNEFLRAYLSMEGIYYNATANFLPNAKPGEKQEYSNIAAGLAGHLIELAAGMSLPNYAKKEVFDVLGMKSTSFLKSDLAEVATPYTKLDGQLDEYMEMPIYDLATFPDGGLRSTVNDMALFLGTIMNEGTLQLQVEQEDAAAVTARAGLDNEPIVLLQPESVQDMLRPRYNSDHAIFFFFFNLDVGGKNRNLIGHNGGDPGAFTYLFFDPDSLTGYFIAGNGESEAVDPVALANLTAALFAHADELAASADDNASLDGESEGSSIDSDAGSMTEEDDSASSAVRRGSSFFAVVSLALLGVTICVTI